MASNNVALMVRASMHEVSKARALLQSAIASAIRPADRKADARWT